MKIVVERFRGGEEKLSGIYEYLEGGSTNGSPSFHIDFGSGLIYFYTENIGELDDLIEELQILRNKEAENLS